MKSEHRLIKHSGQVFTPNYLVRTILDFAGYCGEDVLRKHVIDNSCGDGAFLCEIVDRYCRAGLAVGADAETLRCELETFVHGIELDAAAYANCLYNLNAVAETYGVDDVCWDVCHENAMAVNKYDGKMDYVLGNPPYVRVHNLEDDYSTVKTFDFAQEGMTDLFLVFYELGFQMLNATGRLCYITPSSWISSLAAKKMRDYIMRRRTLTSVIDLGHYQAFEQATTYTMIALFDNRNEGDGCAYYTYNTELKEPCFVDVIPYDEMNIGNNFYLGSREDLRLLRDIKMAYSGGFCVVKNGFATLADKVFIGDIPFDDYTIPVLKASTGKWYKAFYPYDESGKPLSKDLLFSNPQVADYLNRHKKDLLKGQHEEKTPGWFLYGRTQALKDVSVHKFAINTVIKDVSSVKLQEVPAGSGVYSGLYILTDVSADTLRKILLSDKFISYLRMLKKYKSGGYYTFNSKDLEQYINSNLMRYAKSRNYIPTNQYRVSESYLQLF